MRSLNWLAGVVAVSACRSPSQTDRPPAGEFQATQQAVVGGVVVDRNGKPLDSVTVYAHVAGRQDAGYGGTTALTDEAGRFSITIDRYGTSSDIPGAGRVGVNVVAAALPPRYPSSGPRVVLDSVFTEVRFRSPRQESSEGPLRIVLPLP
jgi:hypothetical protein